MVPQRMLMVTICFRSSVAATIRTHCNEPKGEVVMGTSVVRRSAICVTVLAAAVHLAPVRSARAGGSCKIYWTTDYSSAKYKIYILNDGSMGSELHEDLIKACSVTHESSSA